METEASCYAWRTISGAEPYEVKASRTVLNGGDEKTCLESNAACPYPTTLSLRGADNPSSRYPSLSHNTPRSNFIEECQSVHYILGLIRSRVGGKDEE